MELKFCLFLSLALTYNRLPFHSLNRSRKYLPKSELLFNAEKRQDFQPGSGFTFQNSNAKIIYFKCTITSTQ